ncbi:hypothetical protein AZ019_005219, partial [Klebsiella pneumoniae]
RQSSGKLPAARQRSQNSAFRNIQVGFKGGSGVTVFTRFQQQNYPRVFLHIG